MIIHDTVNNALYNTEPFHKLYLEQNYSTRKWDLKMDQFTGSTSFKTQSDAISINIFSSSFESDARAIYSAIVNAVKDGKDYLEIPGNIELQEKKIPKKGVIRDGYWDFMEAQ